MARRWVQVVVTKEQASRVVEKLVSAKELYEDLGETREAERLARGLAKAVPYFEDIRADWKQLMIPWTEGGRELKQVADIVDIGIAVRELGGASAKKIKREQGGPGGGYNPFV